MIPLNELIIGCSVRFQDESLASTRIAFVGQSPVGFLRTTAIIGYSIRIALSRDNNNNKQY